MSDRLEEIHKLMFPDGFSVLYPETEEEESYPTAKKLQSYIDTEVIQTVNLNRIELAKDIKHRHWANDALRDAYLDAVISVSEEVLAELKLKGEKE